MKRYGSIYVVTNTVTSEQYVGQTRKKARCRWDAHINTANSQAAKKYKLAKAIIAYGKEAFLGVLKTSVANAIKQKGRVAGKYTLEKVA